MSDLDVLERLRQARPTDLRPEDLSADSPAAQALAESIVASPRDWGVAPEVLPLTAGRSRSRFLLAAAALTAVAATGAVAVAARQNAADDGRRDDATSSVGQASAATTGRVSVRNTLTNESSPMALGQETVYEFSGEDIQMTLSNDGIPTSKEVMVAGQSFHQSLHPAAEDVGRWTRLTPENEPALPRFELWPARLTEALSGLPDMEEVDTEDVRGTPTRHLRAEHPDQMAPVPLDLPGVASFVKGFDSFDIWLDDDGQVRRVAYSLHGRFSDDPLSGLSPSGPSINDGFTVEMTIEVYDLGGPITIEAPNIP